MSAGQGAAFPSSGNFRIIIDSELILVGARAGDVLSSLTRGIEGTTGAAHSGGASVKQIITAAGLKQYIQDNGVASPASIASGEFPVFNGTTYARSTVTPAAIAGIAPGTNGQFAQTTGGVTVWGPSPAIAPTHLFGSGGPSRGDAVVANQAYLLPVQGLVVTTAISRIIFTLTSVVAGNYDVGIYYSDDEATFTLLGSKGSTAQPAVGNIIASLTTQTLVPVSGRRWYFALALSTGSTVGSVGSLALAAAAMAGYKKASSFPLPATITTATAFGAESVPAVNGAV